MFWQGSWVPLWWTLHVQTEVNKPQHIGMQYNIDASKKKETPRPFSIYIESSKWKDSVAFKEDPEAGISSVLDTLVLLLSTIWVIDPCLLTHTVVLLAKPICFVVHTPVYTQEHPRKVSCFFTCTRLNITSCWLYLVGASVGPSWSTNLVGGSDAFRRGGLSNTTIKSKDHWENARQSHVKWKGLSGQIIGKG